MLWDIKGPRARGGGGGARRTSIEIDSDQGRYILYKLQTKRNMAYNMQHIIYGWSTVLERTKTIFDHFFPIKITTWDDLHRSVHFDLENIQDDFSWLIPPIIFLLRPLLSIIRPFLSKPVLEEFKLRITQAYNNL